MADLYEQARNDGVVVELAERLRLVRVTGPQAVWFLQNTVTADVENAETGRVVESCFLTPKGKLVAQLRIGFATDEIVCDVSSEDTSAFVDSLIAQRFRTKVEFEKIPGRCFVLIGPVARAWAAPGEVTHRDDAYAFGDAFGDVPVVRLHARELPAEISLPAADRTLYDVFRVEGGVGEFGADFGPNDLPQEAGLTGTLSVTKGCYVGQETVARIHFRGHVNRVLRPLRFDSPTADGLVGRALVSGGQAVGRVTSAVTSPRQGTIGLGMVRVEPFEGAELEVEGAWTAVVGAIPEGTKVKAAT